MYKKEMKHYKNYLYLGLPRFKKYILVYIRLKNTNRLYSYKKYINNINSTFKTDVS